MDTDTCIIIIPNKTPLEHRHIEFLDILLDETLINGTIYIPKKCLKKVSTLNKRLPAKQTYEFLLRLAQLYPVLLTDTAPNLSDCCMILDSDESPQDENGLITDCYITALYKEILLEHHLFDCAVNSILELAKQLHCYTQTITFLESMLQKQNRYEYYFQGSQPFLIYTGDAICYYILSVFATSLGTALENKGYLVEYFDLSKESHTAAARYINQSFQAVIGIQTYMFSAHLTDQNFLHDKINGPKYNFVFDHINSFRQHLEQTPKNLTILAPDLDYVSFGKKYYDVNVRFLPPGGIVMPLKHLMRIYDLVFIGSYINNSAYISAQIKQMNRPMRFLLNHYLLYMRKYPNLPAEELLQRTLNDTNETLSDTEFKDLLHSFHHFTLYMAYRYRCKVIQILVEHGIKVDVFGQSWASSPLRNHPNFIWHNIDLTTNESLLVWQQSKIALNTMSWHKNAITERIINSMLQKAVVLTERNPYLEQQFQDKQDILYYDLAKLEELPHLIRSVSKFPEQLSVIGENGYKKALQSHTWDCRAEELMHIIEQDALSMYFGTICK